MIKFTLLARYLCKLIFSILFSARPKIQLYSHFPGEYGKPNTLICYVSGFHPPDITIELLKNGESMSNAQQTDLAFEKGWQFHLTKSASFTPQKGEDYSCSVRHMTDTKNIVWGECYVCISRRYLVYLVYMT